MSVFLVVKAIVPENIVKDFDTWYKNYHLHEAHSAFKSIRAFRGWVNSNQHHAFYEFKDFDTANSLLASDQLNIMIREFDNKWNGKVTRTRDLINIVQKI